MVSGFIFPSLCVSSPPPLTHNGAGDRRSQEAGQRLPRSEWHGVKHSILLIAEVVFKGKVYQFLWGSKQPNAAGAPET